MIFVTPLLEVDPHTKVCLSHAYIYIYIDKDTYVDREIFIHE